MVGCGGCAGSDMVRDVGRIGKRLRGYVKRLRGYVLTLYFSVVAQRVTL